MSFVSKQASGQPELNPIVAEWGVSPGLGLAVSLALGTVALYPGSVVQFIVELPRMRVPTPSMMIRPMNPPIRGIKDIAIDSNL